VRRPAPPTTDHLETCALRFQSLLCEELQKRTTTGAATFLVKVKVHRREPANEEADIQADKAISGKDVPTERHRQDKLGSLQMARASPKRRYGEL